MYTTNTPTYDIDLELPEKERWKHVITNEKLNARKIARRAMKAVMDVVNESPFPNILVKPSAWAMKILYKLYGGRYVGEIEAWADSIGFTTSELTLLNCSYELSQFGCTSGVRWIKGLGMVHVRSMDWDIKGIGDATRLYRFKSGDHEFLSVGVLGLVGVLSGMVPGEYSATINWAPSSHWPSIRKFGPLFLLREVLTDCPTYDEAVYALKHTDLSAPVFYTICGTRKGQACVIERRPHEAAIRKIKESVLVQANHHVARKFKPYNKVMDDAENDDEYSRLEYSEERSNTMKKQLAKADAAKTLVQAAGCLKVDPVRNEDSEQQMAFCPKTGEVKIWRRIK